MQFKRDSALWGYIVQQSNFYLQNPLFNFEFYIRITQKYISEMWNWIILAI